MNNRMIYLICDQWWRGKFGFLDIIQNYENTPSSNLAIFSTGMSYLNLKQYNRAIEYLKNLNQMMFCCHQSQKEHGDVTFKSAIKKMLL